MDKIFESIRNERKRQDDKWGADRDLNNYEWLAILMEEVGEASQDSLNGYILRLRGELIQSASVIVAWIENLDRNHPLPTEHNSGTPQGVVDLFDALGFEEKEIKATPKL